MIRHISTHEETHPNQRKTRGYVMKAIDIFNPAIARQYAKEMVEIESRGSGDQVNALAAVGREVGLGERALRRLINGETTPSLALFASIRMGYINVCKRHVERLQHKIELDRKRYGDAVFEDLGTRAKALADELRRAEERTKGI